MATATSACQNKLSQNSAFENRNNLHDASFSSYLKGAEENMFVLKLNESNPNQSSFISAPHEHVYVGKKKVEDGEIGVFGAEKYFKGAMDEENIKITRKGDTKFEHEKDEPTDKGPAQPRTQPGTPSVQSESSWNSQNALLHHIPRNQTRKSANKAHRKSFFANIGCNCYCNDNKSVNIDDDHISEAISITKPPMKNGDVVRKNKSLSKTWALEEMQPCKKLDETKNGSKREDCFSFPILSSKPAKARSQEGGGDDETMRDSREVFGSPILEKGSKSFSLERKLTVLSWDTVTPRVEKIQLPKSPNHQTYNDTESDASSDLFEIESFSTNTNPTNCYAPSEASIAWSVVTASVADTEDMRMAGPTRNPNRMVTSEKSSAATSKEVHKRRTGFISGCNSQKAVRVVGEARGPDPISCKPLTRFQAETQMTGFDSKRSLSHPNSSHMLYIQ